MRNALADENVNVQTYSAEAAGRVRAERRLHGIEHQPQPARGWFFNLLKWENLTVAGREVKGFVVPQWMAVVLLGSFITIMGAMYKSFSGEMAWQHDQLVILSTQKADAEKVASQEHNDRALEVSSNQAWREKMTNDMAELRRTVKEQTRERN